MTLCWLFGLVVAAVGPVTLWSGETIPGERVAAATDQGVVLQQRFDEGTIAETTLVPWARVRSIGNDWEGAAEYRGIADALWRAEDRLARGDTVGSGWLLEPLADKFLAERGPTSSQIASALTMIRFLDGDTPGAIEAWLVWREDRSGPERDWLDPETGLCPSLPPVMQAMAGRTRPTVDLAGPGAMRSVYAFVSGVGGLESIEPTARAKADPGFRLVWDMVRAASHPDPTIRRSARESLARRDRPGKERWRAAWSHLGRGLSLMREEDPRTRDAGAAHLITVIIEYPRAAPGLTGLARDVLLRYFEETARAEHAESVRAMDRAA
ncbi:MAG: hypothetical protein AAGA55_10560, partial [Planctomycetota bacterium]